MWRCGIIVTEPKGAVAMTKRLPKPEITLDRIYSEFADEGYCKDFLINVRFEKGFACPFCEGSKIESDNAQSYKKPLAQKYFHVFETYDPASGQLSWTHKVISNFKAMIAGTYHGNEKMCRSARAITSAILWSRSEGTNTLKSRLTKNRDQPHRRKI